MDFYSFGLSLDPLDVTQRHALFDSDDEDDSSLSSQKDPKFQLQPEGKFSNIRLLVCAVGEVAAIFVQTHMILSEPIACITCEHHQGVLSRDPGKPLSNGTMVISQLYKCDEGVAICVQRTVLKQVHVSSWTRLVMSSVVPREVLVLASSNIHNYIRLSHPMAIAPPLLRKVSTTIHHKDQQSVPLLEPPNFLQGEEAALLTSCEVSCTPCCAVVCYHGDLDVTMVTAFQNLPWKQMNVKVVPASLETVKKQIPQRTASMLYT